MRLFWNCFLLFSRTCFPYDNSERKSAPNLKHYLDCIYVLFCKVTCTMYSYLYSTNNNSFFQRNVFLCLNEKLASSVIYSTPSLQTCLPVYAPSLGLLKMNRSTSFSLSLFLNVQLKCETWRPTTTKVPESEGLGQDKPGCQNPLALCPLSVALSHTGCLGA